MNLENWTYPPNAIKIIGMAITVIGFWIARHTYSRHQHKVIVHF